MTVLAATSWPDAAIAIAGIAFVTIVASILVWQIFATGRFGLASRRAGEYQKLAEELADIQRETTAELQQANEALAQLRRQTQELELGLKEVRPDPEGGRVRLRLLGRSSGHDESSKALE